MLAMDQMTAHTQLPEIYVPTSMSDNCDVTCGSFSPKSDQSKEGAKEVESPENHQANTGELHTGGNVHAEAELFQARHLRAKDVMFGLGFELSSGICQTFMFFSLYLFVFQLSPTVAHICKRIGEPRLTILAHFQTFGSLSRRPMMKFGLSWSQTIPMFDLEINNIYQTGCFIFIWPTPFSVPKRRTSSNLFVFCCKFFCDNQSIGSRRREAPF